MDVEQPGFGIDITFGRLILEVNKSEENLEKSYPRSNPMGLINVFGRNALKLFSRLTHLLLS